MRQIYIGVQHVLLRTTTELQKYKDLVFLCSDNKILFTAANKLLFVPPGKKDGWAVLGIPEGSDGKDPNILQPFIIRLYIISDMLKDTDHPQESYIEFVRERTIQSDEVDVGQKPSYV